MWFVVCDDNKKVSLAEKIIRNEEVDDLFVPAALEAHNALVARDIEVAKSSLSSLFSLVSDYVAKTESLRIVPAISSEKFPKNYEGVLRFWGKGVERLSALHPLSAGEVASNALDLLRHNYALALNHDIKEPLFSTLLAVGREAGRASPRFCAQLMEDSAVIMKLSAVPAVNGTFADIFNKASYLWLDILALLKPPTRYEQAVDFRESCSDLAHISLPILETFLDNLFVDAVQRDDGVWVLDFIDDPMTAPDPVSASREKPSRFTVVDGCGPRQP